MTPRVNSKKNYLVKKILAYFYKKTLVKNILLDINELLTENNKKR